jgi:hypothetical protein
VKNFEGQKMNNSDEQQQVHDFWNGGYCGEQPSFFILIEARKYS